MQMIQIISEDSDNNSFQTKIVDATALIKKIFTVRCLKGKIVLDAGCGSGWLSVGLAKEGFCVYAIDLSKAQLEKAKFLSLHENTHLFLVRASLTNLPFKEEAFDSIVSSDVIEHIPKLNISLFDFSRVLKKKGSLCITTPNGYGLYGLLCDLLLRDLPFFSRISKTSRMLKKRTIETEHVYRFTPAYLKKMFEQADFKIASFINTEFVSLLYHFVFCLVFKKPDGFKRRIETADVAQAHNLPLMFGSEWFIWLVKP
jgi:2-polyprenyl-3-methyl-5-hydroxy-6-metoxy-1,4-benzoquinol methylase